MRETRVGRNNPCPCGSGRKFKHCCLRGFSQPVSPRAGGPPDRIASVTTYPGSPHPPNQRCKVFDPQTRRWKDAHFKEIQPEQEFIADNRLYKMWSRDVTAHLEGLDVSKIPDADRPYDPANCRTPKANDVVLVLGDKYPNCGHWLLGHLNPGQRCLFQGRVYAIEADHDPRNCKLVGTDLLLVKRPPRFPEHEEAIFKNVAVRETRLTCAPMPAYQGLEGTLTPPTPEEFRRKYEEIQRGDPIAPTEVIFHYTHPEPFGYAEVEFLVDADKFFRLPDGTAVSVLDIKPGMEVRLTDGAVGKITRRQTCFDLPEHPEPLENGLYVSRVTARVKHTALQILQWRLGDLMIEGTPDHLVWSVTRHAWVCAHELQPGEFVRPVGNVVAPVESVGPLKTGRVEVYGIEVEFFHNYFVGRSEDSMLVHNGLRCVNTPVAETAEARLNYHTIFRLRGVGGNGAASDIQSLAGLPRAKAVTALEAAEFKGGTPTKGGWQTFKHADGSKIDIGPGGRVVRSAAPQYGPDGSRINKGQRLALDGSEIPRSLPHDQHPPELLSGS